MSELFSAAFQPITMPLSLLLGIVLLYWLTVIIGVMDLDLFDMDVDADDPGFMASFLTFGDAPFMIGPSLIIFFAWTIEIILVHNLDVGKGLIAWLSLVPVLGVSYGLTWLVAGPIGKVFSHMSKAHGAVDEIVSQMCTLVYDVDDNTASQGRIETDSAPILVSVKARPGVSIPSGSKVLIVEEDESGKFYYVEEVN